jgi:stress response protein YsnF
MSGPDISEDTHDVTLKEERVVVGKETVPRERVRLEKETVAEEQPVEADVRKEHIEVEGDGTPRRRS